MVSFIDHYRDDHGVEPICAVLPVAPSTYYRVKQLESYPQRRSARARTDAVLEIEISRVWHENRCVYGADLSPVTRSTLCEGFSYNLNLRRSQDERQTIYRRADHFDPERA